MNLRLTCIAALAACALAPCQASAGDRASLDAMISRHARANGVPESLVHRIVVRESGYNSRAMHAGNYGLMQIKHGTAKGMGYTGSAHGLLDPETNLTYAVPYLANAYRVAGGNPNRAVSLYAGGYYYAAKRKGMLARLASGPRKGTTVEVASAGEEAATAFQVRTPPAKAAIPLSAFASAER